MHRFTRPCRRALLVALGATLLLAGPAGAHPFVAGGQAPVDSLASLRLTMSHGCGTEDAGGGDPTVEVALEVAADMRIVEVPEVDGYDVALERDADGRVEVVTWTATGDGVAAPELPVDAVLAGEPGTEIHLKVFQGCEGFTYRWVGTPDEPAEDPAVALELVAADPDRPPPPPDAAGGSAAGDDAPAGDGASAPDTEDPGAQEPATTDDDPVATGEDGDGPEDAAPDPDATTTEAAADPSDGEPGLAVLVGVVLLALVVGGLVIGRRVRRGAGNGTADA